MFIKKISLSVGLCGLLLASSALAANDPNSIMGYSASKASPAFHTYLTENAEAFVFFAVHTSELKYVLENPDIQQKLASGKMTLDELDGDVEDESDSRAEDDLSTIAGGDVRSDVKDAARRNLRNIGKDADSINVDKEVNIALNAPVRTIKNPGVRGSTDRESPGTSGGTDREGPAAIPERQPVDMNVIPQNVTAADTLGWPKYLNVPANCPEPEAGIKYIHEFAMGEPRPNGMGNGVVTENNTKHTAISPWFNRRGNWFYLNMTDKETFAIPFYAGDLAQSDFPAYDGTEMGGKLRFDWEAGSGIQTVGAPQFEVSTCPGKFPSAGDMPTKDPRFLGYGGFGKLFMYQDEFNKALAGSSSAGTQDILTSMRLEPGKRYFLNVRQGNRNCDTIAGEGATKRDGHAVCANVLVSNGTDFFSSRTRAPYTGPCLSRAPYPVNYNSNTCQENLAKYGADNKFDSIRIICKDALGKAPDQKYEASTVSNALRWTQGAGKPGYDSYVCVGDWHQRGLGEAATFEDLPTYKLCSRDNEGGKRVLKAIYKRAQTPTVAAEVNQTCVFDEKETTGVYRWKETSRTGNPDWGRLYQNYNDYTLQSYWYDKEGNLVGDHSVH